MKQRTFFASAATSLLFFVLFACSYVTETESEEVIVVEGDAQASVLLDAAKVSGFDASLAAVDASGTAADVSGSDALLASMVDAREEPEASGSRTITESYWAFDPALTMPCASDSNTCTSSSCGASGVGPCATLAGLMAHWGTSTPLFGQNTTIEQLSDDAPPFLNAWNIHPQDNGLITVFEGKLIELGTASVASYVPLNRPAGTKGVITLDVDAALPFVGTLVNDVTAGAWFWVDSLQGSTIAITTPFSPTDPFSGTYTPSYVTVASGDSLVFYDEPKAACLDMPSELDGFTVGYHLRCTGNPDVSIEDYIRYLMDSRVDSDIYWWTNCTHPGGGAYINSFFDSYVDSNGYFNGGAITSVDGSFGCGDAYPTELDGDILVDQRQHVQFGAVLWIGQAYFGGAGSLHTYSAFATIMIGLWNEPQNTYGHAAMWGPECIDLSDGATLVCEENCTKQILLTGGLSMEQSGGNYTDKVINAYPWEKDAGAWGAEVPLTPANVDLYGEMCWPAQRDCFYSHRLP
jgi:hypothetical protein